MEPKEKAIELLWKYLPILEGWKTEYSNLAKQCALIAVENEYNSLRELLFDLRACKVIESEKVYLARIDNLIKEEQAIKSEIEKI